MTSPNDVPIGAVSIMTGGTNETWSPMRSGGGTPSSNSVSFVGEDKDDITSTQMDSTSLLILNK